MDFEVSEENKRIVVKALTGAALIFLSSLPGEQYGVLVGALLAGLLAFVTKVDQSLPGKKAPSAQKGVASWIKHVGV